MRGRLVLSIGAAAGGQREAVRLSGAGGEPIGSVMLDPRHRGRVRVVLEMERAVTIERFMEGRAERGAEAKAQRPQEGGAP